MRQKYPRTFHLPWSAEVSDNDKILRSVDCFVGKNVIATEKLDGENCTIYKNNIHARSLDSQHHWSRSYVKGLQARIGYLIPEGIRLCGENMYAKHSIKYTNLKDYFYLFSVWKYETCLSWGDTLVWAEFFGLPTPRVLYQGVWDEDAIRNIDITDIEGYVIRNTDSFDIKDFCVNVAKFVRKNHVQTDDHWLYNSTEKNELA